MAPNAASPYRGPPEAPRARDAAAPFARSLEEASLCEAINLDVSNGTVRAPGSRAGCALAVIPGIGVALIVGVCGIANLVSGFDLGQTIAGAISGGFFLVLGFWLVASARAQTRAAALINTGKLDEAEAFLGRWTGMRSMGFGDRLLGAVASLRGDHTRALEKYRKSATFLSGIGQSRLKNAANLVGATHQGPFGERPLNPQLLVTYLEAAYHASRALSNLGRIDEARQVLAVAGPPIGDYLNVLRMVALLHIELCSGVSTIPDADLRALADRAGRLEGTWGLLALCGWAYAQRGDAASAERLVRDELARPTSGRLEALLPPLYQWMQMQRRAT